MVAFELIQVLICVKITYSNAGQCNLWVQVEAKHIFWIWSEWNIILTSKLKLVILHLHTCITVLCHHSQTPSFWEWSGNRICGDVFYNKTSRRWRPDGRRLDEANDYRHHFLVGLRILPRWRAVSYVVAAKLCCDNTKYFVFKVTHLLWLFWLW